MSMQFAVEVDDEDEDEWANEYWRRIEYFQFVQISATEKVDVLNQVLHALDREGLPVQRKMKCRPVANQRDKNDAKKKFMDHEGFDNPL